LASVGTKKRFSKKCPTLRRGGGDTYSGKMAHEGGEGEILFRLLSGGGVVKRHGSSKGGFFRTDGVNRREKFNRGKEK